MMKPYPAGSYDIAVIGAGHAGIEAALAAARLGCRTIHFSGGLCGKDRGNSRALPL